MKSKLLQFKQAQSAQKKSTETYDAYLEAFSEAFVIQYGNKEADKLVAQHTYQKTKRSADFRQALNNELVRILNPQGSAQSPSESNNDSNSPIAKPKNILKNVSPKNWPEYTSPQLGLMSSKKTLLSIDQYNEIRSLARLLEREIKSVWPYPNKDRKQIKINALAELISNISQNNPDQSLEEHVKAIKEKYPMAVKGAVSNRVSTLFDTLEQSEPIISNSKINF